DRTGCGQYRCFWPAQAVALARPDWTVEVRGGDTIQAGLGRDGRLLGVRGIEELPDVYVTQRVGTPGQPAVLRWLAEQGVATVVDFDDAMWCIDRGNVAWESWNRPNPHGQHWRICEEAARAADLVTVTTEGLARHYGPRAQVIPNYVPRAAVELPAPEGNEV